MGATYDDLPAVARRAEETGYDASLRSDHYLTTGGDGLPGPTDVDVLGRNADAGAQRVHFQVLDLADLDHLDLVAAEVAP